MTHKLLASYFLLSSIGVFAQQNIDYSQGFAADWELESVNTSTATVGSLSGTSTVLPDGSSGYTLNIDVPEGNGGLQPNLSISYSSNIGHSGLFGVGFNFSGSSAITRVARSEYHDGEVLPPQEELNDRYALDGIRLYPVQGMNGASYTKYKTEVDNFAQIYSENLYGINSPNSFTLESKTGTITEYGTGGAKLISPTGTVLGWFIHKVSDPFKNEMLYNYEEVDGETRLRNITYNNGLSVISFVYKEKQGKDVTYSFGKENKRNSLVERINVSHNGVLMHSYRFGYAKDDQANEGAHSYLVRIQKVGSDGKYYNPTVFQYDKLMNIATYSGSAWINSAINNSSNNQIFHGDFNGDGLSDYIEVKIEDHSYNYGGFGAADWDFKVKDSFKTYINDGDGTFTYTNSTDIVSSSLSSGALLQNIKDAHIQILDLNGDGKSEILALYTDHIRGSNVASPNLDMTSEKGRYKHSGYKVFALNSSGVMVEQPKQVGKDFYFPETYPGHSGYVHISYKHPFIFSDFNKDGKLDYAVFHDNHDYELSSNHSPKMILHLQGIYGVVDIDMHDVRGHFGTGETLLHNLNKRIGNVEVINWSQSAKYTEVLFQSRNWGNTVFEVNLDQGVALVKENSEEILGYNIGDYNGDGLSDILHYWRDGNALTYSIKHGRHNALLNADVVWGGINLPTIPNIVIDEEITTLSTTDLNNDGRSDLYLKFSGRNSSGDLLSYQLTFLNKGYNTFVFSTLGTCTNDFSESKIRFADFNGDSKLEIGNDKGGYILPTVGHYQKLHKISDGYGNVSYIDYSLFSDWRVYSKTESTFGNNTYQIQPAGYLVAQLRTPNGIGGLNIHKYKYEGLFMHTKGKGNLGFEKVSVTDETNRVQNVTEHEFYAPTISFRPKRESKYLLGDYLQIVEELSRKSYAQYTNYTHNYSGRKVFYQYPKLTVSSDFLQGGALVQKFDYPDDQTGNVIAQIVERYNSVSYHTNGDFKDVHPSNFIERVTELYKYGLFGGENMVIPASLTQKTKIHYYPNGTATDANATVVTDYDYYDNGLMKWEKHFANVSSKSYTNHYEYYQTPAKLGLLKRKYTNQGTSSIIYNEELYDYDAQKRLTTIENSLGYISTNVYDLNGARVNQLAKKIGFDNKEEVYYYDGLGRLINTVPSQGGWYKTESAWIPGGDVTKRYKIIESGQFRPTIETYYDDLGRVTKTKTPVLDKENPTNGFAFTEIEYNDRGLIYKETLPYKDIQDLTKKYNFTTYDKYNRPIHVKGYSNTPTSGAGLDTYYEYSKQTTFRTERVIMPDERYKTKTYDYSGKLLSVVDDQTSITHEYYSTTGKLYRTYIHGNEWQQEYTYDIQGNVTTRKDRSLGNDIYTYDALGRLTSKTTPNGTTSYTYDELNRVRTETNAEGVVTTTYINTTSTNGIGEIESVVKTLLGNTIHSLSYEYDQYSNVEKVTELLDGQTSISTHDYVDGRLDTETFGDGIGYKYEYDLVSQMISKVSYTTPELVGYEDLYEPRIYDANGNILKYIRFSNMVTTKKYNALGLEIDHKTGTTHHYAYTYDNASQNLLSKFDAISGKGERFTYTDRDQLATSQVYSWLDGPGDLSSPPSTIMYYQSEEAVKSIMYDVDHYANIVSKSDIGSYAYTGSNLHQLSNVTQTNTEHMVSPLKVHHMTSSLNNHPLSLKSSIDNTSPSVYHEFKLGIADRRISNKRYSNYISSSNQGTLEETRLYFNDYEKLTKGSNVYTIHYIGFGDGTEFVFKKKNSENWSKYVAHIDYQGTIVKLTDHVGVSKFKQNFDVWGRRRHHLNWTLDGNATALEPVTVGDVTEDEENDGGSFKLSGSDSDDEESLYEAELTSISVSDQSYYAPEANVELLNENNGSESINPISMLSSTSSGTDNFDNDNVEDWFNRGYTGHEHLTEANVIHMNARLYDPFVGRFLSADEKIVDHDNADNYNRYAYALNNPTKYTDPSGKALITAALLGAGIAAAFYTYSVVTTAGGFANWHWGDFTSAVAFGAIGGVVTSGIGSLVAASEGAIGWLGQALLHGGSSVTLASIQSIIHGQSLNFSNLSRSFLTSFGSSAMSSLGEAFGTAKEFTTAQTDRLMLGVASLTGGLTQAVTGGNFMRGATTGFTIALLNHVAHARDQNWDKEAQEKDPLIKIKPGYLSTGDNKRILPSSKIDIKKMLIPENMIIYVPIISYFHGNQAYKPEEGSGAFIFTHGRNSIKGGVDGVNIDGKMYKSPNEVREIHIDSDGNVDFIHDNGYDQFKSYFKQLDPQIYWLEDWRQLRTIFD